MKLSCTKAAAIAYCKAQGSQCAGHSKSGKMPPWAYLMKHLIPWYA